jgi:two-component system, NarL family, nitrate/nitrite response regulator NarL
MSSLPFRVTVVDDHALFAEALVIALRGQSVDARSVIPELPTTTYPQLGRAIVSTRPHLVLLDLDLGVVGDPMRLLSTLSSAHRSVIVVTGSADRARRGEALAKGARAVISKSAPFSQIVNAVERERRGLLVMSRADRDALIGCYHEAAEAHRELHAKFNLMTRREAEVLGQLMAGHQVMDIARSRVVSESTVRTQVKSILDKLQVGSQLTAVGLAHQVGWTPPTEDSAEVPVRAARRQSRTTQGRPAWAAAG